MEILIHKFSNIIVRPFSLLLPLCILLSSGCSHVSYLTQAGLGQLALYNREKTFEEVLANPKTPEKTRTNLNWIIEVKKLVESELGVEPTANYNTFVDLKRRYVIWSITAAPEFELKLKEWEFPIVGGFPYLGFFEEAEAQRWAKKYEDAGFETYIRGVEAYSTLGYLRDPFLSSMIADKKSELVNLVYHETAHRYIYIKGEGDFNEQAANFIGDYGERNYLLKNYGKGSREYKEWLGDRSDRRIFGSELKKLEGELKNLYSTAGNLEAMRVKKSRMFENFEIQIVAMKWQGSGFPIRAAKKIKNNAGLMAFLTYEDEQDVFERLDVKFSGDLIRSLGFLKQTAADWERERDKSKEFDLSPQKYLAVRLKE